MPGSDPSPTASGEIDAAKEPTKESAAEQSGESRQHRRQGARARVSAGKESSRHAEPAQGGVSGRAAEGLCAGPGTEARARQPKPRHPPAAAPRWRPAAFNEARPDGRAVKGRRCRPAEAGRYAQSEARRQTSVIARSTLNRLTDQT